MRGKADDGGRVPRTIDGARQRGLASVEFAFSVLVALFLLLVVAELGRLLYSYTVLSHAVRDGARHASVNSLSGAGAWDPREREQTLNLVVTGALEGGTPLLPGLDVSDVTVEQDAELSAPGADYVSVSVDYAYAPLFSAVPLFWGGGALDLGMTMEARNTMRALPGTRRDTE